MPMVYSIKISSVHSRTLVRNSIRMCAMSA